MSTMIGPIPRWFDTGAKDYHTDDGSEQARIMAEYDELDWRLPVEGVMSGPMSPILLIQGIITGLDLHGVTAFAYGGILEYPDGPWETASYSLVALRQAAKNGSHADTCWLDVGVGAVPLFRTVYPAGVDVALCGMPCPVHT